MRPLPTLLLLLATLGPYAAQAAPAAPLRFCYEDVPQPPWTMPDGSGLNIELLKRVEARLGERFLLVRRPWLRCMEETRVGLMDGMIGGADVPERRVFSTPPLLPDGKEDASKALYIDHVTLYLRVGSPASWDGRSLHNPRGVVIAQRGYFMTGMLQARGQRVLDQVKSADEALRLLASGGADVAVLMGHSVEDKLGTDPRFRERVKKAPIPFTAFASHLLIGRQSYRKDPARMEAVWTGIAAVRASAEYRRLEAARTGR